MKLATLLALALVPAWHWIPSARPSRTASQITDAKGLMNCQPVVRPVEPRLFVSGAVVDDATNPTEQNLTFSIVWTAQSRSEHHLIVFDEGDVPHPVHAFSSIDFTVAYARGDASDPWTVEASDGTNDYTSESVTISAVTDVGVWEHPDANSIWVYALHEGWLTKIKVTGVQS